MTLAEEPYQPGIPPELPPWRLPPRLDPPHRRPLIPQVAEPLPAFAESVTDRLLERRIVLVSGVLDEPTATEVAARLMLLDANGPDPIRLEMSCGRGELSAALILLGTLDALTAPVHAVARGEVAGSAVAVYAAAQRRLAHEHAFFTLQEPRVRADGTVRELAEQVHRYHEQLAVLVAGIAAATGQPGEQVAQDLRSGKVLGAREAVAYGLVHEVIGRS